MEVQVERQDIHRELVDLLGIDSGAVLAFNQGVVDEGKVPIDNNWVENQIRRWALGRKNWLFADSLRSDEHAANVTTLIQPAKINGLEPQACLRDALQPMPMRRSDLDDLLPHNWKAPVKV